MENTAIRMESLDSFGRMLGHCSTNEKPHGQHTLDASQSLDESLVDFYVSTSLYLCYLMWHPRSVSATGHIYHPWLTDWLPFIHEAKNIALLSVQSLWARFDLGAWPLIQPDNKKCIQEMLVLPNKTAFRHPIIKIQGTVKETKYSRKYLRMHTRCVPPYNLQVYHILIYVRRWGTTCNFELTICCFVQAAPRI